LPQLFPVLESGAGEELRRAQYEVTTARASPDTCCTRPAQLAAPSSYLVILWLLQPIHGMPSYLTWMGICFALMWV
jgi:hypothetical protein